MTPPTTPLPERPLGRLSSGGNLLQILSSEANSVKGSVGVEIDERDIRRKIVLLPIPGRHQ